jgi:double-strand break repair protein MRE11
MWCGKKVQFLRPEEDEERPGEEDDDDDDQTGFFNIFALHQNRDYGRGAKNCVQEHMIPDWMDLVVWGHEHECLIDFSESVVGTFRITQPGSSVATSLVAGEAVRKRIGIIDLKGKQFRMHTIPLTQVRPFVTCDISLKENKARLDPEDPKIDDKINEILEKEVKVAIKNARDRARELVEDAIAAGNDAGGDDSPLQNRVGTPGEVLIRIRVEHSGFSTINNQRFGARFVGEVANPNDILLFHRRKDVKPATTKLTEKQRKTFLKTPVDPENVERLNMEDLVLEFFGGTKGPERALKVLDEKKLTESLGEFVDKSANSTIDETTDLIIKQAQKAMLTKLSNQDATVKGSEIRNYFEEELAKKVEAVEANRARTDSTDEVPDVSMNKDTSFDDDTPAVKKRKTAKATSKSSQSQRSRVDESHDLSSDDDVAAATTTTTSRKTGKAASQARPKRNTSAKKTYTIDSDDEDNDLDADADDSDEDISKKRSRTTAAAKKKTSPPILHARKKPATTSKRGRSRPNDDSDDESFPGGPESYDHEHWGSTNTKSQL